MPALVQRVDVEVRLQREAQRVPGVRVAGEAVQQQQRGAALAAPVQGAQAETLDDEVAVERA